MELLFLGTSSSEGIPNPFCKCNICQQSRINKGKDIRTRSALLIDQTMLIDMAPEFSAQLTRENVDSTQLTDILFTHTHPDHFNIGDLYSRMVGYGHNIQHPLNLFGSDISISECNKVLSGHKKERFNLNMLIPYRTYEHHAYKITPILANHNPYEFCYMYVFEKNGSKFLYGLDSGWFPDSTWEWLENQKLDLIILECSLGYTQNERQSGHMSIETVISTKNKLRSIDAISSTGKILLSHISHNTEKNHAELSSLFSQHEISIAFDGLTINLQDAVK